MIIYTSEYNAEKDILTIDATCGTTSFCPPTFRGVAILVEASGPNPCLSIPRPVGVNGVKRILELVENWSEGQK